METPSSRSLQLLALLQSGREWTAAALGNRMGVSERTVRRDARRLRDLGYDVSSRPGPGGTYRLHPGLRIPPLLLDPDDVSTIITGLLVLEAWAPDDSTAAAARAKIEQVLPPRLRRRAAATALATQVLATTPSPVDWQLVGTIADAIAAGEHLRFDYRDKNDRASHRAVEPYRHILRGSHWYLIGYDVDRDDWRLFRIDRIRALRHLPGGREHRAFPHDSIGEWLASDFGSRR